MDLPTFSDVSESAQQATTAARAHGRTLIPWLPDPPNCTCGALCYADHTFDPREAMYVTSWYCKECDVHYTRDPVYGSRIVNGPSPGADTINTILNE